MTLLANVTFSQLLKDAIGRLKTAGCEGAELDARLLLQAASGLDRSGLMVWGDDPCPKDAHQKFTNYIERRAAREPVFRILGAREFHGLSLQLGSETLEPRDDTEALVEAVLDLVGDRTAPLVFLDLGTGSGAVVLALLLELQNATAIATDLNSKTLEITHRNAVTHGLDNRLELVQSNWLDAVEGHFDFIASNPPYIRSSVVEKLAPEVLNHDPRLALDGGIDGLDAYRAILKTASQQLKPKGFLALEIGFDQLIPVKELGESLGWSYFSHERDLSGNDRVLIFKQ